MGARASTSLALLLHELAINAVKYGALSNPDGRLVVDIDTTITIAWRECGDSDDNGNQGFGTELMRAALRGLGGTIEQAWRDGERVVRICLERDQSSPSFVLSASIRFDASALLRSAGGGASPASSDRVIR